MTQRRDGMSHLIDPVLVSFVQAADDEDANRMLVVLLTEHAHPIIKAIIRSHLNRSFESGNQQFDEYEDLISEVNLQVLERLRQLRISPDSKYISSFGGYVSVTAYNTCHKHLRRKYPQRSRLKYRVRYLLTRYKQFALWEDKQRNWLCGLAHWKDRSQAVSAGDVHRLGDRLPMNTADAEKPIELLSLVFREAKGPIEIDDLVTLLADIWRIKDYAPQSEDEIDLRSKGETVDSRDGIASGLEQQFYLKKLWSEICRLPLNQRTALLLNLRDRQDESLLALLTEIRVTTLRQIGEALEIPIEELAELWNHLPIDDATIAKRLGINRQQVINLRLSARRRLARRLRPVAGKD